LRQNPSEGGSSSDLSLTFVAKKEESTVLDGRRAALTKAWQPKGATDGPAKLVKPQPVFARFAALINGQKWIAGLKEVVLRELKRRTVKCACASLAGDIDLSDAFILGGVCVVLQLKLPHRINRRSNGGRTESGIGIGLPIDLKSYG
jgi:hypothetical protein